MSVYNDKIRGHAILKKHKITVLFFCVGVIAICTWLLMQKDHSRYINLDGEKYTRKQIVDDFINIVFGDAGETVMLPPANYGVFFGDDVRWLKYIAVSANKTLPLRLSRWPKGTIEIGLGWPPLRAEPEPEKHNKKYAALQPYLSKTLPLLESATGLKFQIRERATETEVDFARLRIIFYDVFWLDNKFKAGPTHHFVAGAHEAKEKTERLRRVDFTPLSRTQVDGYFIPAAYDGSIIFSSCEIWPNFENLLEQALVTECLVRSLGFFNVSMNRKSILGHWNNAHDPHSKRKILDGDTVNYSSNYPERDFIHKMVDKYGFMEYEKQAEYIEGIEKAREVPRFPHELTDKNSIVITPTEYDSMMMSLLYCDDLKPRDHKEIVRQKLLENNVCF